MARKAKDLGSAEGADGKAVPKSAPTPELYAHHTQAYLGAMSEVEEIQETLNAARGRARNILRVAKKDGCDTDAITLAVKLKKREAGEVVSEYRNVVMILKAIDAPLGTQWDMFSDVEVRDVVDAEAAGYQAGKNGESADNNAYQAGTEEHAKWHDGWLRGQAKLLGVKAPKKRKADDFVEDDKPGYQVAREAEDADADAAAERRGRRGRTPAPTVEAAGTA